VVGADHVVVDLVEDRQRAGHAVAAAVDPKPEAGRDHVVAGRHRAGLVGADAALAVLGDRAGEAVGAARALAAAAVDVGLGAVLLVVLAGAVDADHRVADRALAVAALDAHLAADAGPALAAAAVDV